MKPNPSTGKVKEKEKEKEKAKEKASTEFLGLAGQPARDARLAGGRGV